MSAINHKAFTASLDLNPGTVRHTVVSGGPIKLEPSTEKYNRVENSFKLTLLSPGLVQHPEHGTLKRPEGFDMVNVAFEYDPFDRAMRPVFD